MKTNKIAMMAFVITASSSMLLSTAARSQTYKANFTTKTVLAGAGTDLTNTITLAAPSGITAPFKLTLPNAEPGGAGYVLTAGTNGSMSWTDPTTSLITLNGDVTGPSSSNTVVKINGSALGSMTGVADANTLVYNSTTSSWNPVAMSADVTITHAGVATIQATPTAGNDIIGALDDATTPLNTADNLTTSGTLSSGGDATLGTASGATANSFGTGSNAADVMNTIGSTGTGSVTTINGGVNFTGAVSYTTAPTIPLTDDYFLIGNGSGDAAPEKISGDILVSDVGVSAIQATTGAGGDIIGALNTAVTTKSLHADALDYDATLEVTSNALGLNLTNPNTWTGEQTFSGAGTGLNVATGANFAGAVTTNGNTTIDVPSSGPTGTTDINAGTGTTMGTINIGNNGTGSGTDSSTTNIAGALNVTGNANFTGTVTLPSGSVTASSLALADNKVMIGGSDGFAHAQTLGTDISTTDAGAVTVVSATGATGFSVTSLTQTNGALDNTGSFHSHGGDANINTMLGNGNVNIGDSTNAGNINIGNTASTNAIAGTTGIIGATTVTGTTNINNTGAAVTTIGNSGSTNVIAGGTTIGAVTLSSPSALDASSGTLTVNSINSLYLISTAGAVTTIAGLTPTTGRIVELINKSSGVVTLTYNVSTGNFALNGADVLLGPSGSVSLIYDGANWNVLE
jgi:hypothetical protein